MTAVDAGTAVAETELGHIVVVIEIGQGRAVSKGNRSGGGHSIHNMGHDGRARLPGSQLAMGLSSAASTATASGSCTQPTVNTAKAERMRHINALMDLSVPPEN